MRKSVYIPMVAVLTLSPILMNAGNASAGGANVFGEDTLVITKVDANTGKRITGPAMDSMSIEGSSCFVQYGETTANVWNRITKEVLTFPSCDEYEKQLNAAGDDPVKTRELGVVAFNKFDVRRNGTITARTADFDSSHLAFSPNQINYYREATPPTGYQRNLEWHKRTVVRDDANDYPEGEYPPGIGNIVSHIEGGLTDTIADTPGGSNYVPNGSDYDFMHLRVNKVSNKDGEPLKGAEFTLRAEYRGGGSDLDTFATDESGRFVNDEDNLVFSNRMEDQINDNLELDNPSDTGVYYTLQENKSPEGYKITNGEPITIYQIYNAAEDRYDLYTGGEIRIDAEGAHIVKPGTLVPRNSSGVSILNIENEKIEAPTTEPSSTTDPTNTTGNSSGTGSSSSDTSAPTVSTGTGSTMQSTSAHTVNTSATSSGVSTSSGASRSSSPVPTANNHTPSGKKTSAAPKSSVSSRESEDASGAQVDTGGDVVDSWLVKVLRFFN